MENMNDAIFNSPSNAILTTDDYSLAAVSRGLTNDGTGGSNCKDLAIYFVNGAATGDATFQWVPNNWRGTIKFFSN